MPEREKRRYLRIHFERQAQLDFFTEVYDRCQVQNISLSGMFIQGEFPHELDDQCYVNLTQTSKNTYLTLQALAKVTRHDEEGIGLKFISMSFESLLSLEMILLYQEKKKSTDVEFTLPEKLPFKIREEPTHPPDKYKPFLSQD